MFEDFKQFNINRRKKMPKDFQLECAYKNVITPRFFNFSVPGSGKTMMSIMTFDYLCHTTSVKKMLIIGPKNGIDAWRGEIKEELDSEIDIALANDKINFLNYEKLNNSAYYEFVKNFIDEDTLIILDEFHRIKNPNAKRSILVKSLVSESKYVTLLSGSPLPNGLIDLKTPCSLITDTIDLRLFNDNKNTYKVKKLLEEYSYCATKSDLNLPKINYVYNYYELSDVEKEVLKIIWTTKMNFLHKIVLTQQYLSGVNKLVDEIDFKHKMRKNTQDELLDLLKVRKHSSKLMRLSEMVFKSNKPIIIWCQYVATLKTVEEYLNNLGYKTATIYGATSSKNRSKIIEDFRGEKIEILITNYATLAESISLHQTCHDAIIYEYTFNLVHYTQAKDRIYRVGLKPNQETNYYYSISTNTTEKYFMLEEIILNEIIKKENLLHSFLDEAIITESKNSILYEIEDQIYDFSKFSQADKVMHQKFRQLANSTYYPIQTINKMTDIFGTINVAKNYFEVINDEYNFINNLFIDANYKNIEDVLNEYTNDYVVDLTDVIDDVKNYQLRSIIPATKTFRYLSETMLCNIIEIEELDIIKDKIYDNTSLEEHQLFFNKYPKIKEILKV